jgi:amino acid transporter
LNFEFLNLGYATRHMTTQAAQAGRQISSDAPLTGQTHLVRRLGLWSSIGIVIGITIGSGIFRTPAGIATRVPDPRLMMSVWLLGGFITMCGALSVAELAGALPHTGGLYVYLREGWGRLVAFLFGWSELVLIRASALGAISTVFGEYLLRSIGIDPAAHEAWADYLSAGAIVFAALVNVRGVQFGAAIVGMSTVTKFSALAFLVAASFLIGGGHGATLTNFMAGEAHVKAGLFGLALISVLWAYDGFADLSFASGEVANPQRNLPRAIIFGTLGILVIYLSANAAYLYVSPVDTVARSRLIAADTMYALFGQIGVVLVSVVVMISAFGSLNGSMLASPRVFFAMADDGLFFRTVARVHPDYKTPYVAILLAAALGVTFVLTRTFEQLADTFVLSIWPFYAFGVAAIYRLRASRPDLPRPYKVIGYPVVPAIFIAGVVYLVLNALITDTLWTSVTFAIVFAGVPVYYAMFAKPR